MEPPKPPPPPPPLPPPVNQQQQHPMPSQQQLPQPHVSQPPQQPRQEAVQGIQDPLLGQQHDQLGHSAAVVPAPLTSSTPARSVTPVTPGTPGTLTPTAPTAPTFSHGQVLNHPKVGPGVAPPAVNYSTSGKSVNSKGKKSKEEKEREKEMRKQRLRIQQEQERQWKILQQKRALEQQRQQQQQQQENILLRKELKNQQQAKGIKAVEEQKKKRLPKGSKRTSMQLSKDQEDVSSPAVGGEVPSTSNNSGRDRIQQQQQPTTVLPVGPSLSEAPVANANVLASSDTQFHSESSLEFLAQCDGQTKEGREGDLGAMNSNHEISNLNCDNFNSAPQDTSPQFQTPVAIGKASLPSCESGWEHHQGHNQVELSKAPNVITSQALEQRRQHLWTHEELPPQTIQNCVTPENIQSTNPVHDQHVRPNPERVQAEQAHHGGMLTCEQMFQENRHQAWLPRPCSQSSGIQTLQPAVQNQQPGVESGPMVQQPPISDTMHHVPLSSQSQMPLNSSDKHQQEVQQPSQLMHWEEELSQVRAQVAAAHDLHPPQSVAPHSAPAPPPLPPPPSSQQLQPASMQAYNLNNGWPQHGQVSAPPAQVPAPPMVSFSQQAQKPVMPQMPFQPIQQPQSPMPPNQQHAILPMSTQAQEPQMIQVQQQDAAQQQQREQLIRAQQQQFFQILQQQQVLQHQQQQQQQQNAASALQPGFARARFNPVMNTKDLPEIDTEEEHQERLRFLYRQRQAQKQQQMHAQLMQQVWFQQQLANGGGQGVMPPPVMPVDPSSPQLIQQIASQQLRPQLSELTQQQLVAEHQRRMQQRQELGQQTVQYNKVLQEFQQQQGISGGVGTHATGPFVEVPQQRFALRQPTPVVQPGLKPIMPYGLDGNFAGQQQQLYSIQLQQQMLMMQQKSEQNQQNNPQSSPALATDLTKVRSEASGNLENEMKNKAISPDQSDAARESQCASNMSVEELSQQNKQLEIESRVQQSSIKVESTNDSLTGKPSCVSSDAENETMENTIGGTKSGVAEGKESNSLEDTSSSLPIEAHGNACDVGQVETTDKRDGIPKEPISQAEEHAVGCLPEKEEIEFLTTSRDSLSNGQDPGCKEGAGSDSFCVEDAKGGSDTLALKIKKEEIASNLREESQQVCSGNVQDVKSKAEECTEISQVAVKSHQTTGQEQSGQQSLHFCQDSNILSKQEPYHEMSQAQVHHASNQIPQAASQPQQFLLQQQLLGLQQQLVQMEQQRQVLVQQYQQLQQQLQQGGGQDPVLTSQIMAVQSRGQILQQQMIQIHQQMQLLPQQFAVQQQQPQAPQWPHGIQNQQMAVQPGGFPVRPGLAGMQHPMPAAVAVTDKVRFFVCGL